MNGDFYVRNNASLRIKLKTQGNDERLRKKLKEKRNYRVPGRNKIHSMQNGNVFCDGSVYREKKQVDDVYL